MNYDVDYFIDKFQRIPEWRWIIDNYADYLGRRCAQGHCGSQTLRQWYNSEIAMRGAELHALRLLFDPYYTTRPQYVVALVNNGEDPRYQQPTPKQRILAALRDIKAKQEAEKPKADVIVGGPEVETPKPNERIVYVTVDSAVRELQQTIGEN